RCSLAHERRRELRQARDGRRIVVAAGALDDHLEEDLRRAMVFDDDQVHTIGEIGLLRLRQRDLEDLLVDRGLVLQDGPGRLRRVARGLHRRLLAGDDGREGASDRERECMALHCWPPFPDPVPAADFGMVTTTERFSLVRYFLATRCTSAAVIFL